MVLKRLSLSVLNIFFFALIFIPITEAKAISESYLERSGFKVVACPNYIGHLRKGLASSVLPATAICLKGNSRALKKIADEVIKTPLPLASAPNRGYGFTPINNEEGDVQTGQFEVGNFPALVKYKFVTSNPNADFKITVVNAEDPRDDFELIRLEGSAESAVALNTPGKFYLKIIAYGVSQSEPQPTFSVSISFTSPYSGVAVNKPRAIAKGLKFKKCPNYLVDIESEKIYTVGDKYVCSKKGISQHQNAGFTISPFNFTKSMFLEKSLVVTGCGGSLWLPFRVERPVLLHYKVSDPSHGNGDTKMSLYNLNKDRKVSSLVTVEGDISNTTTNINTPGDYYIVVQTSAYNEDELGKINWEYSLSTE